MDSSGEISQHWQVSKIFLSYLIAITGSFCTIQLMEKWRSAIETRDKLILLMLSSVALGGCGIWCMHFTGMNALELTREDGSVLTVNFEAGLTILSFICAVGGVFIGLWIASADPFFLELEQEKRKNILVKDLAATAMSDVVNKQKVAKRIKFIALFSRLPRIAGGASRRGNDLVSWSRCGLGAYRFFHGHGCVLDPFPCAYIFSG
ncbi:hypothetical protein KRP22_007270 [Phytophthora ramorum]|nr:hypothetical protein KRP22_4719 [Phytophthora ramorum]